MKNKLSKTSCKQGFTLIELLVVVLTIGILAAGALPQYQKAVEKARAAEAITVLNTLQKGVDIYLLEHGSPLNEFVNFMGQNLPMYEGDDSSYVQRELDIPLSGLTCGVRDVENNPYCYSKDFVYYASCQGNGDINDYYFSCNIFAARGNHEQWQEAGAYNEYVLEGKYALTKDLRNMAGKWSNSCEGNCPSGLVW